ncbi:hypothetical protein OV090_24670 [Nannocystis sp. RBIL2]|uniref:hypothetical protein n=1 Tax=Nannocystis sp. RBIL2 TaxID=2996788 RepID=UPI00226DE58D|nr:hypothetical protein [Nannocystis sp. RBIL2]MCY1067959.1 hypothetical protein [Nannocystis sp. RBIL2]
MHRLDHRVRVWEALYPALAEEGSDPLQALLGLMEQGLRVFTKHSEFNIRDFGINYLDSEMPRDYIGRVVQDCGVYALNVAYELSRVIRRAKLRVEMRLVTAIDHAMLVIHDIERKQFYVLSNDVVEGPFPFQDGEPRTRATAPAREFMRSYAKITGTRFGFGRFLEVPLADPTLGKNREDASFKDSMWERYELAADWGFVRTPGVPEPEKEYSADIRDFDLASKILYAELMAIASRSGALDPQQEERLVELGRFALGLALRNQARPVAGGSRRTVARQKAVGARLHFVSSRPEEGHPLSMLAKVLASSANPSPAATEFLRRIRGTPFAGR